MRSRRYNIRTTVRWDVLLYITRARYRYPVAVFLRPDGGGGWEFVYRAAGERVW